MFRAALRIFSSVTATLVVLFSMSGNADAKTDRGLDARKDALTTRIEKATGQTEVANPDKKRFRISQWYNWSNWPNWNNWLNWNNW